MAHVKMGRDVKTSGDMQNLVTSTYENGLYEVGMLLG